MPLGFQRLNERVKRPNELINFIKPLPTADEATARDFLERIAAIVYPVMKANYIAVMSLEEFPSNREFWGRNFNAGEAIQLVLKSPSGAWLPFRQVQMVMIHELAHCKEMNHSRFFWRARNAYAEELRALWQKNYTGEGFWGAGRGVQDGAYLRNNMPEAGNMPESLCGGVYRNKGKRRRKTKNSDLSWAERKQRRILKKFGAGGTALGGDEEERQKLEAGKRIKGKPRVAASVRARELRAAAALARLESPKVETIKTEPRHDSSETEDEDDTSCTEDESAPTIKREAKDLVRVCDGEDANDANVKEEQQELNDLWRIPERPKVKQEKKNEPKKDVSVARKSSTQIQIRNHTSELKPNSQSLEPSARTRNDEKATTPAAPQATQEVDCAACSCTNTADAVICIACNNVLDPTSTWNHWRCSSVSCAGSAYVNLGDYNICQVCGSRRPEQLVAADEEDEL